MKLCKNHCPNTTGALPEQIKRSFYQNTARVTPDAAITATNLTPPSYEQPFPGYEDDYQYFTRMYPVSVRPYVIPVRDAFDRMEYTGSLLFDRYPDREALLRIADEILGDSNTGRDPLIMLMLHEFMHRRERYRRNRTH